MTLPPVARNRAARELLAALGLYLMVLGLAFGPQWLAGHSFRTEVIWDPTPVHLQSPADTAAIRSFAAGQVGIWDSSRGLGTPSFVPVFLTFFNVLQALGYALHSGWGWEACIFLRLLLAGFFTFLLARALPLRFPAALVAGAGYMLCGYFRVFINFQHLNLEVVVPLLLWSLLCLRRQPTLPRMLAVFFSALQIWAGGNPSSLIYALLLGSAFSLFVAALPAPRASALERSRLGPRFLPVLVWIGFCLGGGFLGGYLPVGIEFAGQTADLRWPGIGQLSIPLANLAALVTPLLERWLSPLPASGEARLAVLNFVPHYLGFLICVPALIALLHPARQPRAGLFFILVLPFTLGMVFGIPPFSWLDRLPVLRYSQNFRYVQPYLVLCAALAGGMGLHLLLAPGARRVRRLTLALAAAILLWLLWQGIGFRAPILASTLLPRVALAAGITLAGVVAVLFAARFLFSVKSRRSLAAVGLTAASLAELLCYFHLAAPFYGPNAYSAAEPPPAAWLRRQPGWFRLLGTEPEALHPNLAGMFGLEDVRDSTPMYLRRYLQFVSALDGFHSTGAALANFLENGRFFLDFDLGRIRPPLLDLLNVRYVLSQNARDRAPLALADATAAWLAPAEGRNYISPIEAVLAGVHRPALLTHAPSRADLILPAGPSRSLVFEAGMLPESRRNPAADGAVLLAVSMAGPERRLLYCRHLNPRREAGDGGWIPLETSLPPGAESLSLRSLPGPRDNRLNDFAVWGEPGLRRADPWPNLALVYDRDLRIYENRTARPRAFWVQAVEWLKSDREVLMRLTAKGFDHGATALIHARPARPELSLPAGPAEVKLTEHEWGRATVRVSAQGAGFLVLSDLYYPGWQALLDGIAVRIYPVDLALRGLPVPAGDHEVRFRYNPISFHLAGWAILATYGFAILMLVFKKLFLHRINRPVPLSSPASSRVNQFTG